MQQKERRFYLKKHLISIVFIEVMAYKFEEILVERKTISLQFKRLII